MTDVLTLQYHIKTPADLKNAINTLINVYIPCDSPDKDTYLDAMRSLHSKIIAFGLDTTEYERLFDIPTSGRVLANLLPLLQKRSLTIKAINAAITEEWSMDIINSILLGSYGLLKVADYITLKKYLAKQDTPFATDLIKLLP